MFFIKVMKEETSSLILFPHPTTPLPLPPPPTLKHLGIGEQNVMHGIAAAHLDHEEKTKNERDALVLLNC